MLIASLSKEKYAMSVAGIDVAYKSLAVVIRDDDKSHKAHTFSNDATGHATLIRMLRKAKVSRLSLEATGQYHLDLCLALDQAGFEVMVLNPKAAKRFAEAMLTRSKTDTIDAEILAQYTQRMPFRALATARCPGLGHACLCQTSRRFEQGSYAGQKPAPRRTTECRDT